MTTLHEKLKEIVLSDPNRVVMQIKHANSFQKNTYQKFYDKACAISQALILHNIQKGDRISIVLENCLDWGCIYFGIIMTGAIAVPLDPQSTPDDVKFFIEHAQCKIVFTSNQLLPTFQNIFLEINSLEKLIVTDFNIPQNKKFISLETFIEPKNTKLEMPEITQDDIASILYTSGTTGTPKGVMLTHKNFYSNYESIDEFGGLSAKHNFLSILPLHHSFPFMATLIFPLFSKNKITYLSSLKQSDILDCIKEAKITALIGVPQLYTLIAQSIENEMKKIPFLLNISLKTLTAMTWQIRKLTGFNLSKNLFKKIHVRFGKQLKFLVCGGAKLNPDTELFLDKLGFTIIQGYGLTETSPAVTFNPTDKPRIGSTGKTIPNVDVKILDPDQNNIGEILIRGPNVMKGYYENQQATNDVIKDGWFYSGDLGYFDKDNYLFLTGRKKEVIVLSNGKNIYPDEVEAYYEQSNYIKELCILQISKDNIEKLVAVIVPDFEYFQKIHEVNVDFSVRWDVENFSKKYPAYKRMMDFILTKQELPKTRLGKLKRYEIKEKYLSELMSGKTTHEESNTTEEDFNLLASNTFQELCEILKAEHRILKPIQPNDHLELDLGFDSLNRIELYSSIERHFNIKISEQELAKISTLKELTNEIDKLSASQKPLKTELPTKEKTPVWKKILSEKPPSQIIKKIELTPTSLSKFLNFIFTGFLRIIFKLFFRFKIHGIENLPKDGRFMLCANHTSFLDAFFIAVALPRALLYQTFSLGFANYFDIPIVKHIVKSWRIIPIDPAIRLVDAMQATSYVLQHNKSVCIFPEARRSIDGTLQSFRQGVGILAQELDTPIVPISIRGAFESWPRTQRFPKPYPISITFGKPCAPDELKKIGYEHGARNDYEAITLGLYQKILELSAPKNESDRHPAASN